MEAKKIYEKLKKINISKLIHECEDIIKERSKLDISYTVKRYLNEKYISKQDILKQPYFFLYHKYLGKVKVCAEIVDYETNDIIYYRKVNTLNIVKRDSYNKEFLFFDKNLTEKVVYSKERRVNIPNNKYDSDKWEVLTHSLFLKKNEIEKILKNTFVKYKFDLKLSNGVLLPCIINDCSIDIENKEIVIETNHVKSITKYKRLFRINFDFIKN